MLDVIDFADTLETGVFEEIVVRKGAVDGDIYVPVDCRGQDEPPNRS